MSCFDKDYTPLDTERLMLAKVGAANPAALRVASMLVRKYAFDDVDLLSTKMAVRIEISSWYPSHHDRVCGAKFRQGHDHQSALSS